MLLLAGNGYYWQGFFINLRIHQLGMSSRANYCKLAVGKNIGGRRTLVTCSNA